jgi:protein TonB
MQLAVDTVLAQRARLVSADSRASIGGSLLVHLLIAGACAVAPLRAAQRDDTVPEFVPVYVVPAQALGIHEPIPEPRRAEPAPPRPEPEAPPPPEADEPVPRPEPVLPSPQPRRRRKEGEPAPPAPAPRAGAADLGRRQGSPTGSSTGTSPFGGASVSFADQNFTYGYYIDQMLAMIHAQWQRPALGAQVEAAVFFRIRRDGKIVDLRVVESSGFNIFDLAGLRAVRQAAPFPRLPVSYPQNSLAVKLILQ